MRPGSRSSPTSSSLTGGSLDDPRTGVEKLKAHQGVELLRCLGCGAGGAAEWRGDRGAYYNTAAWAIADKGLPIAFVVPKEGAPANDIRVHIADGTKNLDAALAVRQLRGERGGDKLPCREAIRRAADQADKTLRKGQGAHALGRRRVSVKNLAIPNWDAINAKRQALTEVWNRQVAGKIADAAQRARRRAGDAHDAGRGRRRRPSQAIRCGDRPRRCLARRSAAGEFIALLGPSGCGKTTLLRCTAGFVDPTSGEIRINGRSMNGVPPNRRPVNTVFQQYALFPHMTAVENVAFGPRRKRVAAAERRASRRRRLAMVGLEGFGSRYPRELSGRTAAARRARPRHREQARRAASRRAARRARPEAAKAHAGRAQAAASPARHDLPFRDPRSGGGAHYGGSHRRHARGRDRAARHRGPDLPQSQLALCG